MIILARTAKTRRANIVLEESELTTENKIRVSYPITNVVTISVNSDGSGTNYADLDGQTIGISTIMVSPETASDIGGSGTTVYVEYEADSVYQPIGSVHIPEHRAAMANAQIVYEIGTASDLTEVSSIYEGDIGSPTFEGEGLDDLSSGGTYDDDEYYTYVVEIDGTGTPDTFKWSDDDGKTWDAEGVSITGASQNLNRGVTITFGSTTGHTEGDKWYIPVSPGVDLTADYVECDPPDNATHAGFVVTGVTVVTDGSDIDVRIFNSDRARRSELLWSEDAITPSDHYWASFSFDGYKCYVAVIDNGDDATPSKTFVKLFGYPRP